MSGIYALKAFSSAEEYIHLEGEFAQFRLPCMKSEIQFLNRDEVTVSIALEGGLEVPDLIFQDGIHFVSDYFRKLMDKEHIDYVFYKKIRAVSDLLGIHETFWMIIPPRIDCVDLEQSVVNTEWDFENGLVPGLEAEKLVLSEKMLGRFQIFKVAGILDNNIYLTEQLMERMQAARLEGVGFWPLQAET